MKRFLPILLTLILILTLCACGDKEEKNTQDSHATEQVESLESKETNTAEEENKGPVVEPPTGGNSEEIGSLPLFPQESTTTTTTKGGTQTTTKKSSTTTTTTKKTTTTTTKRNSIELPPVPLN